MDKSLAWYIDGQVGAGTSQGATYRLNGDFRVSRLWLHANTAPTGSNLIVDIMENGVSIFSATKPSLVQGNTESDDRAVRYDLSHLAEGSVITMDVLAVGNGESGRNLTVQLDLEDL